MVVILSTCQLSDTTWNRCIDLARTWTLLARIPDGLNPLRETFEEHVKKSGLAAVQGVAAAASAAGAEAGAKADAVVSSSVDSSLGDHGG